MDISRSADGDQPWTVGASLFSGRPDPSWTMPAALVRRLEALWRALDPLRGVAPVAPALGYRGCFAGDDAGERRFTAYDGAVTLTSPSGDETREDHSRAFERFVIESAPAEQQPEHILALAGLERRA